MTLNVLYSFLGFLPLKQIVLLFFVDHILLIALVS